MNGVKSEVCYSGLQAKEVSSDSESVKGKNLTYGLGITDIFDAVDVDDFWTELFAGTGARSRKLGKSICIL